MMEGSNYSLSDIAAVSGDNMFGGNSAWLIILFVLIFGMGGWNRQGDYSQFASAASQNEILLGQKFSDLDNKADRGFTSIGNGISDATYALNNAVTNEGRGLQTQLANCCCENKQATAQVRYDMANFAAQINSNIDNKFASLEKNQLQQTIAAQAEKINQLQLNQAMCGVVRYPTQTVYSSGCNPFCNCNYGGI